MAIANSPALKARGAREGDPVAAASCGMRSRYRNSTNDVGWRIWTGNYGNQRVTQLAPQATSVGHWNVGPQDQPYGLFARGFERSTGRLQMGFVLDPLLWGGLPRSKTAAPLKLVLQLVYFDTGTASFDIEYSSTKGCKTLASVHLANSGRWVELDLPIRDGRFGRECPGSSAAGSWTADLLLKSTSVDNAIIHGFQISKNTTA
jgi:hypothetical protein